MLSRPNRDGLLQCSSPSRCRVAPFTSPFFAVDLLLDSDDNHGEDSDSLRNSNHLSWTVTSPGSRQQQRVSAAVVFTATTQRPVATLDPLSRVSITVVNAMDSGGRLGSRCRDERTSAQVVSRAVERDVFAQGACLTAVSFCYLLTDSTDMPLASKSRCLQLACCRDDEHAVCVCKLVLLLAFSLNDLLQSCTCPIFLQKYILLFNCCLPLTLLRLHLRDEFLQCVFLSICGKYMVSSLIFIHELHPQNSPSCPCIQLHP